MDDVHQLQQLFGPNVIEIPIPSLSAQLITEVLHPFYIFQLFSCSLWWAEGYIYYPIVIMAISILSISWTVYFARTSMLKLRAVARNSETQVNVIRDGKTEKVWSTEMVPGDIIEVREDVLLPCD